MKKENIKNSKIIIKEILFDLFQRRIIDKEATRARYRIRYRGWLPCVHCLQIKQPEKFDIDKTVARGWSYNCRECQEKIARRQESKKIQAERHEKKRKEHEQKRFVDLQIESQKKLINLTAVFDIAAIRQLRASIAYPEATRKKRG